MTSQQPFSVFDKIDALVEQHSSTRIEPFRAQPAKPRKWKAEDPAWTEWKMNLAAAYEMLGTHGLRKLIREKAEEMNRNEPHAFWRHILDDLEKERPASEYYTLSLHPDAILPLIRGDFVSKIEQDQAFRDTVKHSIYPTPTPGAYIGFVARSDTGDKTTGRHLIGTGPTIREMLEVTEIMRKYIQFEIPDEAAEIDTAYPQWERWQKELDHDWQGRYCGGSAHDRAENTKAWLDGWDKEILNEARNVLKRDPNHPDFDKPMASAPCFVGFGRVVSDRMDDHKSHKGTNNLHGLFTAVLRWKYGLKYETHTYSIMKCVKPEDADLVEALMSMLASAYWWSLGLSPSSAGRSRQQGASNLSDPSLLPEYRKNEQRIEEGGTLEQNLAQDRKKVDDFNKQRQAIKGLDKRREDVENLEKRNAERLEALRKRAAEMKKVHADVTRLQAFKEQAERKAD